MDAEQHSPAPESPSEAAPAVQQVTSSTWFQKLSAVIFVVFCFEIGLFLLIYPWTDAWTDNTLSLLGRGEWQLPWRRLWNDSYFRGAISGAGILNLWIALSEVWGMFRRN